MKDFYEMIQSLLVNEISVEQRNSKFREIDVMGNECVYIIDYNEKELIFKKGFHEVLGYGDNEMNLDLLSNAYHPDDKEIITKVIREAVLFTLNDPSNGSHNTLSLKYRRRKKDGSYITVLSQSYIYDLGIDGLSMKSITKLRDISFLNDFSGCAYSFDAMGLDKEAFDREIHKVYHQLFTGRELEVIHEISKGFSNKEIGERLFISGHTVATHRKNIFRKAKCSNVTDLILFCETHHILKDKVKKTS